MHGKMHAEDCLGCETKEGLVDRIEREILLVGNLTDEQRQRLLEIANNCPVHRTLTTEIHIETRLTDAHKEVQFQAGIPPSASTSQ
jgi:putative redox protein